MGRSKKTKVDPVDPPVDPILAHFVCKKAKFGVKIAFFSNMYFRTKCHFWGPQITFHWVLSGFGTSKMIKCAHWDPLRAPVGSEMVPEGPKMAPKTLLGPFWPILVRFFLGPGRKFF